LAKCLALANNRDRLDQVVFIPASYGAVLAAATAQPLLLDRAEEALVIPSTAVASQSSSPLYYRTHSGPSMSLAILDSTLMDTTSQSHAKLAAVSLLLDAVHRNALDLETLDEHMSKLFSDNHENGDNITGGTGIHNAVVDALILAGQSMSLGIKPTKGTRSMPLAFMCSLLPTVFPEQDALVVLAGLAPSMYALVFDHSRKVDTTQRWSDTVMSHRRLVLERTAPPLIANQESVRSLLGHVQANEALWNCIDASDQDLRAVLQRHVLV
jgi:hypothetical protein